MNGISNDNSVFVKMLEELEFSMVVCQRFRENMQELQGVVSHMHDDAKDLYVQCEDQLVQCEDARNLSYETIALLDAFLMDIEKPQA